MTDDIDNAETTAPEAEAAAPRIRRRVFPEGFDNALKSPSEEVLAPADELTPKKGRGNHTSFKPGASGNPKGRPKGAVSLKSKVSKALNKKVSIRNNGRSVKVPFSDALILKELERAGNGDRAARANAFNWMAIALPEEVSATLTEEVDFGATGDEILAAFEAEILERNGIAPASTVDKADGSSEDPS